MDINRVLARVDIDAVLAAANLDDLVARVDLQAVVDRLDLDQIVAKVDLNAALRRVDIDALVERTEVGALMARSGSAVMAQTVDMLRSQGVGLDSFVHRWVDRILRRRHRRDPAAPRCSSPRRRLRRDDQLPRAPRTRGDLEDTYAGAVTRFVALAIDLVVIGLLFSLGGLVVEYVLSVLLREPVRFAESSVASRIALLVWAFLYMAYPLAAAGRTLGMAIVGVRAVRADGRDLDGRHAVVRVLALPLSFLLFGLGFVLILLRRDRRALHDLIASTAVVYAWDARAARLRFLLKQ